MIQRLLQGTKEHQRREEEQLRVLQRIPEQQRTSSDLAEVSALQAMLRVRETEIRRLTREQDLLVLGLMDELETREMMLRMGLERPQSGEPPVEEQVATIKSQQNAILSMLSEARGRIPEPVAREGAPIIVSIPRSAELRIERAL